jgi:nucleotidyltransferase substrate binding protein (TIGR01987 family)
MRNKYMGLLNFDSLTKAITQLEQGLKYIDSEPDNDLMRDGVIQRFEYTMDLSWKFIQRYLKDIAQVSESSIRSKKDLFREAAKLGLIIDAETWIGHYEARNETSHTYNSEVAQSVFARAKIFVIDARQLLEALQHGA